MGVELDGEKISNGGFGLIIDGTPDSKRRIESMLHWDVTNGVRRAWARNKGAIKSINRAMKINSDLTVTVPSIVNEQLLDTLLNGESND